jgi:hypothetical protein
MSTSHSSSTTSTQQAGRAVGAGAQAATKPSNTILVAGEAGDSVNVQSQLATSNVVAGDVTSKSNIGQVVRTTAAHSRQQQHKSRATMQNRRCRVLCSAAQCHLASLHQQQHVTVLCFAVC